MRRGDPIAAVAQTHQTDPESGSAFRELHCGQVCNRQGSDSPGFTVLALARVPTPGRSCAWSPRSSRRWIAGRQLPHLPLNVLEPRHWVARLVDTIASNSNLSQSLSWNSPSFGADAARRPVRLRSGPSVDNTCWLSQLVRAGLTAPGSCACARGSRRHGPVRVAAVTTSRAVESAQGVCRSRRVGSDRPLTMEGGRNYGVCWRPCTPAPRKSASIHGLGRLWCEYS